VRVYLTSLSCVKCCLQATLAHEQLCARGVPISLFGVKSPEKKKLVEMHVGEGSNLFITVHNVLVASRSNIIVPGIEQHFVRQQASLVNAALNRVMARMQQADLSISQLTAVLQPSYSWRHQQLPLASWVAHAISTCIKFDTFVEDVLLTQLWNHVKKLRNHMVTTLVKGYTGTTAEAEQLLDEYFNFEAELRAAFMRSFFRYSRAKGNTLTNQYAR
jgi:hypothetical protein